MNDYAKQPSTAVLKTDPKRSIQKTAEATGDLTVTKITDEMTRTASQSVPKTASQRDEKLIETLEKIQWFNDKIRLK